jgi:nucleotide-binding universal stress UspA family protein
MNTRILVPMDGSPRSEAILPYVEALSNRLGTRVTLLHVFPSSLHDQRDTHVRYIENLASQLQARLQKAAVEVDGFALEGKPHRVISDYAARQDVRLIAASPHSQSSAGHWTVGRTMDKVVRETSKPVLLVPTEEGPLPANGDLLNRVVVPLDGSPASRAVLADVQSILGGLWTSGAGTVWLVHVIPSTHYAAGPIIAKLVLYGKEEGHELRAQASRYLEEVAARLRAEGRKVETSVLAGDAAEMILQSATDSGANLIAMTTHGYSGFSRLFLGSTAERVLHKASIPLLLVKPLHY